VAANLLHHFPTVIDASTDVESPGLSTEDNFQLVIQNNDNIGAEIELPFHNSQNEQGSNEEPEPDHTEQDVSDF